MRNDLSFNRVGWLYRLDYKKVILIAFLLRFIAASAYDIFVSVTDRDILLPDSKFYSMKGRYISLLLSGYGIKSFTEDMIPGDRESHRIFLDIVKSEKGRLPESIDETSIYSYLIGLIYFIFGYFPLGARLFNIILSISSAYLLFRIARRHFGELAANAFLLVALFLPTQCGYSLTLSRDFLRVFVISLILWLLYGGVICLKKQKN